MEKDRVHGIPVADPLVAVEVLTGLASQSRKLEPTQSAKVILSAASRLVALSEPLGLAAEKFRVLMGRLESLRTQRELKSLQITSSTNNEGKSLVASNLAVTFAKHSDSKVLLIDGNLRKPTLAGMLGLTELPGLTQWWSGTEADLAVNVFRLDEMPLWFLSAGGISVQPSHILQSTRFGDSFKELNSFFDWIIVDSTPMFPIVDANLWSRLLDGTILVVREGITPIKILKKGLANLDNPKLVGVVLNEASEYEGIDYNGANYRAK
jgi:protein-tyrosine kinase